MEQPKTKILLVDDEALVRELLARYLRSDKRFIIDEAADGFTAVSKTLMKTYHLAILDVAMPNFNGIEAIKNMRANCPKLKFIIITGLDDQEMLKDCHSLGCPVIRKPIEKKKLLDAVNTTLNNEPTSESKAS